MSKSETEPSTPCVSPEPKTEPLKVRIETFVFKEERHKVLTCVDGRYVIRTSLAGKGFRWAMRHWPNDGIGVPTHGREDSLEDAIQAAHANWEKRKSID